MKRKILDFIDFEKVNLLLEGFNNATGFVTAILDLDGNVLSKSGWRQICTEFHRVNPETAKKCTTSDTVLAGKLGAGEKYHAYKCLNGLVDVAVPIIINGEHVANLFTGQYFFEKPDKEFFIKQAKKYKFDNKTYLDALDKVPIVSEEKVKTIMDFLLNMINVISEMTQQRIEQKEHEEQLAESEKKYRDLINLAQEGIWVIDKDNITSFVNPSMAKILKYAPEEVIGKSLFDFMDEAGVKIANKNLEDRKAGLKEQHDFEFISKTGDRILCTLQTAPIIDNAGNYQGAIAGVIDITERKLAEEKIKDSEQKYKALFENAPLSYQSLDEDGRFIDINPSWLRTLGYERDEVIGKFYADFLHPDWQPHFEKNFPAFKKRGYVNGVHYKIKHKKGHYIDIEFEGCIGYLPDGSFKQTYCVFQDVTGKIQADNKVKETKANLESLIDNRVDSIWSVDCDYKYLIFNKYHAEVIFNEYGIKVEKDLNALEIHPVELHDFLKSKFEPVFEGQSVVFEFLRNLNGSDHYFEIFLNPIIIDGIVTGASALSMDVTERKKAEVEIIQSQQHLAKAERIGQSGYWSNELATGNIEWSEGMYRIFGLDSKQESITYERLLSCIHEEDRDKQNNYFEQMQSLQPGQSLEIIEYRIVLPSGEQRWIEVDFETQFDTDNKPKSFFGTAKDITDSRKTAKELVQSQKRYQSIFDNSPVPLWEEDFSEVKKYIDALNNKVSDFRTYFDDNPEKVRECAALAKIIDVNNAGLKLHEANSKNELISNLSAVFTEKSFEAFKEQLIAVADRNLECEIETNSKTLKGKETNIYLKWMVVPGYEKTYERIYISTSDISELKKAENAMLESEEKFRGIYEQSPIAIEIYDKDGKLIDVNHQTMDMFGIDDKKYVLGFDLWEDPNLNDEKMLALKSGQQIFISTAFDFEIVKESKLYPTSRSGKIYMDMYAIPLFNGKEITGYLLQIIEVTDRKLAEDEIRKQLDELQRWHTITLGRESRVMELKQEVNNILKKHGENLRYNSTMPDDKDIE